MHLFSIYRVLRLIQLKKFQFMFHFFDRVFLLYFSFFLHPACEVFDYLRSRVLIV